MISRLSVTQLDKSYLAARQYRATAVSVDFFKVVVNKPWGHEYLMYGNPSVEVWNLFIKHNSATSMHCHPNKKTALVILDGHANFSSLNGSMELAPMDAVVIEAGAFHSTQAASKDGVRALEFETPPMKHDLVRLEDKYGRVNEGYEGLEKMIVHDHLPRFLADDVNNPKDVCNNRICVSPVNFINNTPGVNKQKIDLAVIINGSIVSKHGDRLYGPVDIIHPEEFGDGSGLSFKDLQLLTIKKNGS